MRTRQCCRAINLNFDRGPGARTLYLACRYSNTEIDLVASVGNFGVYMGIIGGFMVEMSGSVITFIFVGALCNNVCRTLM